VTPRVAIVTTTINFPEATFTELARAGQLVVAGDARTPQETERLVRDLDGVYLTPTMQKAWKCSEDIGWNSIQRRNIAFLEAYTGEFDYIVTVDDDNCPEDAVAWMAQHLAAMDSEVPPLLETTESGWFNPGSLLSPPVWARGMPYAPTITWPGATDREFSPNQQVIVGVNAGLWLGDPDIDAMQRITNRPETTDIKTDRGITMAPGTWAPINSQNTMWRRELLPLAVVLPHVGRWDDIFGGFLAQWSFWASNHVAQFGLPLVRQDRNTHNLWRDLEKEIAGYENTLGWVDLLASGNAAGDPIEDLAWIAEVLTFETQRKKYLKDNIQWDRVASFLDAWVEDWEDIL
jgi:hypothetical protein